MMVFQVSVLGIGRPGGSAQDVSCAHAHVNSCGFGVVVCEQASINIQQTRQNRVVFMAWAWRAFSLSSPK